MPWEGQVTEATADSQMRVEARGFLGQRLTWHVSLGRLPAVMSASIPSPRAGRQRGRISVERVGLRLR